MLIPPDPRRRLQGRESSRPFVRQRGARQASGLQGNTLGVLVQLNVSPGGIPKTPVLFARVSREGVAGDRQRNRKYHGGPDRAVCLFSEELYADLRGDGVDLLNGAVGENFTTRGIDLNALAKGDRFCVGDACIIEITGMRVPCATLRIWDARLPRLLEGRSGWVAKVIAPGTVRPGDPIEVLPRQTRPRRSKERAGAA